MNKKITLVFSHKTKTTPKDKNVRIGKFPTLLDEADEIHISVALTQNIEWAEKATKVWQAVAPVKVGGPAFNKPDNDFTPGMYMKKDML